MPGPSEIAAEIAKKRAGQIPPWTEVRLRHLRALSRRTKRDAILYAGKIDSAREESGVISVLDEFEAAKREVAENPRTAAFWLRRVDHPAGFLTDAQKAIDRAEAQVREWLGERMLKEDWGAAKAAAEWLAKGDHKRHGRPISIDAARGAGLRVTALEDDQALQDLILSVFHAAAFTIQETGVVKIIENQHGRGYKIRAQPARN